MPHNTQPARDELRSRYQIKDFAHTLDAVSFILRRLRFPLHKLRDVVDGLQGAAGGRREFELSHLSLARRLRHAGKDETAQTYAQRKVAALDNAQRRAGRLLFTITRGGGVEHKRTQYVDHLTAAANWMMQAARESEGWAKHPARAIEAQVEAAIEMLPIVEPEGGGHLANPLSDDEYISRNVSHLLTLAENNYSRIAGNGGDPVMHARELARRLERRAEEIAKLEEIRAREDLKLQAVGHGEGVQEGVQKCTPSEDRGAELLAAALVYARAGLPVFPVRPDKAPHTANGFKDATTDEGTIRDWWRRWPDAGIGIPTGEASGLYVVDVDVDKGGDVSLIELCEREGISWPDTQTALTGSGGFHYDFQYPHGLNLRNTAGKLGRGVDTRGEGGYVVAPPSPHASGRRYEWLNDRPRAPLPARLLELLTALPQVVTGVSGPKQQPQAKSGAAAGDLIAEGSRNDRLYRIGCSLRGKGATREEIETELQIINDLRCSPPLPDSEVRKIAGSCATYSANRVA